jgi:sulfate permease, SulP family
VSSTAAKEEHGLSSRLGAAGAALRQLAPKRAALKQDTVAGLIGAIGSVPDGMASGVLAGVSPIYGLYASMVGPFFGGLFASTELLLVTTTSAAAIAAGQTLAGVPSDTRDQALFLLVLLIGVIQIAAGLLRLGSLTRFVSHSVMVGFLTGIGVIIVLGQLGDFTGYAPKGNNKVTQTINLLFHVFEINPRTLVIGLLTLALAILLPRTRLGSFGTLLALVIPSILLAFLPWDTVARVSSNGPIPRGLPAPSFPSLSALSWNVVNGAIAIAAVVLVQGAGVSQSVRNPDGRRANPSRDFLAQGAANAVCGFFRGLPVGGSTGQTALNVSAGAQTRWASILSGVWMAIILILFTGLVGHVPMASLAALLILAGFSTIRTGEITSIWQTGWNARICIATTFVSTLFLPIQAAVGIGAALSAILHLSGTSSDIRLVAWVPRPDGRIEEREPPKELPSNMITVLTVYGSLFYAGAWTLARILPSPRGAEHPVVILRMRGRTRIGSTLIDVLATYADELEAAGGQLYLTGADTHIRDQLERTGKVRVHDPAVNVYPPTNVIGEASLSAYKDATEWLASVGVSGTSGDTEGGISP